MVGGRGFICLCFRFPSHDRFCPSMSHSFGILFVHLRVRGLVFSTLIWVAFLILEVVALCTSWSYAHLDCPLGFGSGRSMYKLVLTIQHKILFLSRILNVFTALPALHRNTLSPGAISELFKIKTSRLNYQITHPHPYRFVTTLTSNLQPYLSFIPKEKKNH